MSLRYLMRTVTSRKGLVRNPTSFIRGEPMHTNIVAVHSNLSSRKKVFAVLYVGADSMGVSYYDPVSQEVKSLWYGILAMCIELNISCSALNN